MKDWIIIAVTLLILAIVIDGIRRKRNERYGKIRMSPNMKKRAKNPPLEEPVEEKPSYVSELPNGGARVIGHRDPSEIVEGLITRSSQRKFKKTEPVIARQTRQPEQTRLNLDEAVPMLMESVDASQTSGQERVEPHFAENSHLDDLENSVDDQDNYENDHQDNDDYESDQDSYEHTESDEYQEEINDDDSEYDEEEFEEETFEKAHEENNTIASPSQEPEEVLVVHVMAKDQMLNGSALLDTVLQCGMRYGNMDIFHRYSDAKGEGAHLFSMANMVKPGTFDLDAMDQFETPGVSFFMTLPINADSMQTFDLMVDTARTLAETLGGELKDDQRSVMTKQTLEHCRQRIRDYERQRLFRRPK